MTPLMIGLRTLILCVAVLFGMLYFKKHGLENVQQHWFGISIAILALLSSAVPILFFLQVVAMWHGGHR